MHAQRSTRDDRATLAFHATEHTDRGRFPRSLRTAQRLLQLDAPLSEGQSTGSGSEIEAVHPESGRSGVSPLRPALIARSHTSFAHLRASSIVTARTVNSHSKRPEPTTRGSASRSTTAPSDRNDVM